MKFTIVTVMMSLLSMAKSDSCEPGYFSTSNGCMKCYCDGVSDQCHAGSFYTETVTGGLENITGAVYEEDAGWYAVDLEKNDDEAKYQFDENDRASHFLWQLPSIYTGNLVRSYNGYLNLTLEITAFSEEEVDASLDVFLEGYGDRLFMNVEPDQSGDNLYYSIPLIEWYWRVSSDGLRWATRKDMMETLLGLEDIRIYVHDDFEKDAIIIKEVSLDVAIDDNTDIPAPDSIEVCDCPDGYSGLSCEFAPEDPESDD